MREALRFIGSNCRLPVLAAMIAASAAFQVGRAEPPDPALAPLDLAGYKMTFQEDFKRLDISNRGPGTTWIAHTPWNGDFGNDRFGNPATDHPFRLTQAGLQIIARQSANGQWVTGLICSRDSIAPDATGFAQQYGYFEMRAKLPAGSGVWPAFWLIGTDRTAGTAEIDVMEYYGRFPDSFRTTEHFWSNGSNPLYPKGMKLGHFVEHVPAGLLARQYNDYGVLITPRTVTYYFNRMPYWTKPTPDVFRQPFYVLADLALGGGWPIADLHGPIAMDIAYIHVYGAQSP